MGLPKSTEGGDFSVGLAARFRTPTTSAGAKVNEFSTRAGNAYIACRAPTRALASASECSRVQFTHAHKIAIEDGPIGSSPSGINERVFRADS